LEQARALEEALDEMSEAAAKETEAVINLVEEIPSCDDDMDWSWDLGKYFHNRKSKEEKWEVFKDDTSPSLETIKRELEDSEEDISSEGIEVILGIEPTPQSTTSSLPPPSFYPSSGDLQISDIDVSGPPSTTNKEPEHPKQQYPFHDHQFITPKIDTSSTLQQVHNNEEPNLEPPTNPFLKNTSRIRIKPISRPDPKTAPQSYLQDARSIIRRKVEEQGRDLPNPSLLTFRKCRTRVSPRKPLLGNLRKLIDVAKEEEEEVEGFQMFQIQIGSGGKYYTAQDCPSRYPSRLRKELIAVGKEEKIKSVIREKWPEYMTMEEAGGGHFFVKV